MRGPFILTVVLTSGCAAHRAPQVPWAEPDGWLDQQVVRAGFIPAHAPVQPGTLVLRSDGSSFLDDCFGALELTPKPLPLPSVEGKTRRERVTRLRLLTAGTIAEGNEDEEVFVTVGPTSVEGVPVGALEATDRCLGRLDLEVRTRGSLDHLALVNEVLVADHLAIGQVAGRRSEWAIGSVGRPPGISGAGTTTASLGFSVVGPVVLGFRCRAVVGLMDDGTQTEASTCFGWNGTAADPADDR